MSKEEILDTIRKIRIIQKQEQIDDILGRIKRKEGLDETG